MYGRPLVNLTTIGNVMIGLGVAVWVVYALARWGFGQEVMVRQFLPFHLSGVIPGALSVERKKSRKPTPAAPRR